MQVRLFPRGGGKPLGAIDDEGSVLGNGRLESSHP